MTTVDDAFRSAEHKRQNAEARSERRVARHRERRRVKRQNRAPRLRVSDDGEARHLHVALRPFTWSYGALTVSSISLCCVYFLGLTGGVLERGPFMDILVLLAALGASVPIQAGIIFRLGERPARGLAVARDGRFLVRGRFGRVTEHGRAEEIYVNLVFSNQTSIELRRGKSAIVVWKGGFGDRDVTTLRTFCKETNLRLFQDGTPEKQDDMPESEWVTQVVYNDP